MDNAWPPAGSVVAVAMSGGVDSSTAALLLLERGYRVFGITMHIWTEEDLLGASPAEPPAVQRARQAAEALGIPWHLMDLREPFRRQVVEYLIAEYTRGRTPNPCLMCNQRMKFGLLLEEARRLGASHLATGHYVRIAFYDGRWHLLRGRDRRKDQSYMLYMLGQDVLAQACFPLGELTKAAVRRLAAERGLPAATQEESQEICFLKERDYRSFLRRLAPERLEPGPIFDVQGREIGRHKGLAGYTIGQRKGLGIAAPEPLYVLDIDVERNALIVGPASQLGSDTAEVEDVRYVSGETPAGPFTCTAKIRYQAEEVEATVIPTGTDTAEVHFARPLRDITPGQGVVFYAGEEVLGGGILRSARFLFQANQRR